METLPPVKVPVLVKCVSAHEIPPLPATNFRPGQTTDQLAAAVRADLSDLEEWAIRAEAILRSCAQEPAK